MTEPKTESQGTPPAPGTRTDGKTVALRLETELDASAETVWRALTDPAIIARWLLPIVKGDGAGSFAFDGGERLGGRIEASIVESEPPERLAWLWRLPAEGDAPAAETILRFALEPLPGDRTRLRLVHDGFTVPADYPVDRVAAEEDVVVLLPIAARRLRRLRPVARLHRGALPTLMRLAA